jgi:import inner membrane translocase subunit TIM8
MDPSVSQLDLEQLNENDKAELRQFVGNENQRTRVRERRITFAPPRIHTLC